VIVKVALVWDVIPCGLVGGYRRFRGTCRLHLMKTNKKQNTKRNCYTTDMLRLRWSIGSVLAFSSQVRGFKPGRGRRIFKGEIILSTLSFGGEVKPSVPCRRFAACKRSLNGVEIDILAKLPDNISRPQFHLSLLGFLASLWTWRHLATKVGTSKGGGK